MPIADHEISAIHAVVGAKEDAVRKVDLARLMEIIDKDQPAYAVEQKHWLQYCQNADFSDFQLKIEDIAKRDQETYVATITQQYKYGSKKILRKCRFNQKFVWTPRGWKDSDLEFKRKETEHFTLLAMEAVSAYSIKRIAEDAEAAYHLVYQAYGETPRDKTIIKIYNDPFLVRELTKITADRVMYGWYEFPESIKMVVRKKRGYSYKRTIAHELMHKTSLTQAHNQCPWLAEGLAVYFGTFPAIGGTYIEKGWLNSSEHINSVGWLETQNPENLSGWNKILIFYGTSGMLVKHIEAYYGKGKVQEIVRVLGRFPQNEEGFEYQKHNRLYNDQLHNAIKEVLKVDPETFNERWMAWIKKQAGQV